MSGIWWVVGLIVGMRAGRRISRWGDDDTAARRLTEADDLSEYDRESRARRDHPERFRREWREPEPEGMSHERLAELLDGDGIPTPEERRFIRDWLDSHDETGEEL